MIDTEQMAYFKIIFELLTLYSLSPLESVKGASLFVDLLYTYSLNLHSKNKKVSEDKYMYSLQARICGDGQTLARRYNLYADHLLTLSIS